MDTLWPRRSDRLFESGGRGPLAGWVLPKELSLVAVGYKAAADALVSSLGDSGRDDALVWPILFCYRQYLELRLKATAAVVHAFHETGEGIARVHNLKTLWFALKPRLECEQDAADAEAFAAVEALILEFHDLDPHGTALRYPEQLRLEQLDLSNLRSVMNRLACFLDALHDQWEAGVHAKF